MADTGIFATTTEVQYKVGANANTTANSEAYINSFIAQAESFINVLTKTNYSDTYAGLNADVKMLLKEAASNLAAMYVINYDLSGFPSRYEAETRLDVLRDAAERALGLLMDKDSQAVVNGTYTAP